MPMLIAIALKSLLIAGLALGLLALMKRRSAAERSWVAHIGLLALIVLAFAPLVLPSWNIEAPALFGQAAAPEAIPATASVVPPTGSAITPVGSAVAAPSFSISAAAAATAVYAVPAAILLLITFLALTRLVALRARADVLVDGHWLTALARAQRRMGFKHGTALLTSDALASPISWGLMRPVILLNRRAVEAADEAEAIIAHELAHVARMDWVKLLLARVATALFWFNPFVWMLAREAHQLREEAADDAVLAADIADTEYAQLLVGVARHECPGLLLGAHGVAPSKSSLARRVARVLDGKIVRGPVARSFALGVLVGAVLIAAPLAALTLTPGAVRDRSAAAASPSAPADLPRLIASGVSTAVSVAKATSVVSANGSTVSASDGKVQVRDASGNTVAIGPGKTVLRGPDGKTVTVYPADSNGRRRVVLTGPQGTVVSYADEDSLDDLDVDFDPHVVHKSAIDRAIELRAVGASPAYAAAIREAAPGIRLTHDNILQLASTGVTPDYVRELSRAGYLRLGAEEIVQAKSAGITADYARAMAAAGYARIPMSSLVQLKAVGVTPADVSRFRRAGRGLPSVGAMIRAKTLGLEPSDLEPDDDPGG